jgi:hypothetical protein
MWFVHPSTYYYYSASHWALVSLRLDAIEAKWFRLQPELEARDQWDFPSLFKWSQARITGNPPTTQPLINQSSCTGEHVEISDWVWLGLKHGILWSWVERPTTRPRISTSIHRSLLCNLTYMYPLKICNIF